MVFELTPGKQMAKITIVMLFLVSVLIPFFSIMQTNSGVEDIFRVYAPKGQLYYLVSKTFALCAFILLWWQLIFSLLNKIKGRLHIYLGLFLFSLVLLHVLLFFSAASVRTDGYALHIFVPEFTSGYYKNALSFGVIAFLFLLASIVAGLLRNKISLRWKLGHRFVFIVYALVLVHSFMIGSEMQSGLFLYIFYFSVVSVFSALLVRMLFKNN